MWLSDDVRTPRVLLESCMLSVTADRTGEKITKLSAEAKLQIEELSALNMSISVESKKLDRLVIFMLYVHDETKVCAISK